MAQIYEQNASEIMEKCSQALQTQQSSKPNQFGVCSNSHHAVRKDQFKQLFVSTLNSCISPLEESQNNKIIEKLRKKNNKKKQLKEVVIRKTDLGQNQLIFTKEELEKLKEVDEQELYGINSNPPQSQSPLENLINVISGENANKKYFRNPNFDNPQQQISNYLEWVEVRELKDKKDKKKSKILNFQKKQRSSSNSIEQFNKKIKNPLPVLMPKHSSPFRNLKNLELSKAKSCYPLIKKNSVDKGFLNSINVNDSEDRKLGQKQKMNEILLRVNQHIEKQYSSSIGSKNYIYMTQERKQALYECEVLRRVKREIGHQFYQHLQLSYGNKLPQPKNEQEYMDYEKQNDDKTENILNKGNPNKGQKLNKAQNNNLGMNGKQKNYAGQKQKIAFQSQAERMIHKNNNRLKEERKRVIQRIVC